jgi:hypothetical protein
LARITLNQLILNYKKQNKLNRKKFLDSQDALAFLPPAEKTLTNKKNKNNQLIMNKVDFGNFDEFSYESLIGEHDE